MHQGFLRTAAALLSGVATLSTPVIAQARTDHVVHWTLPAQDLGSALRAIAARAGWELYALADEVNGIPAPALDQDSTARAAIERLLSGTGLEARFTPSGVVIRRPGGPSALADSPASSPQIVVTGSRIRGVPPAAPVETVSSEDMRRAGQSDLGEAVRSLPMNFGGGQNPGIGTNQGSANVNVNGAASVNLLGLGPNATLTLLDGNRLSYTGVNAAVDISAIPASAVERIEIVADGASAIYGADAVAGVVNVRLRRDYDGAEVQSRLGAASDGGGFQQQYGALVGRHWSGGGILAAYDHLASDAINARDRSFTQKMGSDATIAPRLGRHSALVNLFQDITPQVSGHVEVLFKDGRQDVRQGYLTGQSYLASGAAARADTRSFAIAPGIEAHPGGDWVIKASGAYASDRTRIASAAYANTTVTSTGRRLYDNRSYSAELGADGPVFTLPAGAVRAAIGGGYRRTSLDLEIGTASTTTTRFNRARDNVFGYAELYIPLIAPEQKAALGRKLAVTGAFRWEHNSGVGSIAVPKLGIVHEPVDGLTLKASWGRSFRLPALYQQYSGYYALLLPTTGYGSGYHAGSTFIGLSGANPGMKAERSESWTASAEAQPGLLPGLTMRATYFHFDYRDKVASPVTSSLGALNNPLYASLITLAPSPVEQQDQIAGSMLGLQNLTGKPYDPANVVAVLDIRERNVARALYRGVDASARYSADLGAARTINLALAGTWIHSEQTLLRGAASTTLAGSIFNPPRFRGRASLAYAAPALSLAIYANYASSLTDARRPAVQHLAPFTTFDLAAQIGSPDGFALGATINNVFNRKPAVIVTGSPYETTYDSTNFSAMGRFIAVTLRKTW